MVSSLPNNNKSSNRRNDRTDVLDSDDSSDSESMANDDDAARTWPPPARPERDEDRANEELRRMEREVERRMEKEIESLREMDRHFSGGGSGTTGLDRDDNTRFGGSSSSSSRSKYYNDDETTIYGGGSTDGDLGDLSLLDGDTAGGSHHLLDASYDADLNDLLDHNNGGGGGSKIISDSSDDDDDDDEEDVRLMNPYTVMNPPLLRAMEYKTVASSVELSSSITTKKRKQQQQQQQRPGRSPTPVMSNVSPRHSTTANHPLSVFDPYHSPTPSQQHSDMKKKKQQQKQLHPLSSSHHHQHGGLEMEDSVSSSSLDSSSEIIDFVQGEDGFIRSHGSSSSKKSASYYPIQEERFETLPRLPPGQWSDNYYPRRDIEESTSFSPFPKQQHQQQQQHDWRGEPTTSRGTIPPRYYGYGGPIPNTIISTLSEVARSMISSAAYYGTLVVHAVTTNSFVYGTDESDDNDPRQHQRRQQQRGGGGGGGSSNNNPFQEQNQQYRRPTSLGGIQHLQNKTRGRRRRSWMTSTNLRLLLIMSIVLLCLRNLTSMIHYASSHDDNSSIANNNNNNNPTDISLKIKEAKRHWWNKKNKNDIGSTGTTTSQVNGKKTTGDDTVISSQSAAASTTTDGDSSSVAIDGVGSNGNNNDSSPSTNAGSGGSVVVQTREDGTILIKLPPPHMHLEQPDVTATVSAMIDEQQHHPSYTLDGLNGGGDDETMYIKLPYSPPQQQQMKPEQLILHDTREDENDGNINHVLVDLWKNKASPGGDDLRSAYQDYLTETKKYSIPTTEGTTLTKREIEPPLRGAAPQEFVSVSKEEEHVGLRQFSRPLPLVEDEVEHHISTFGAIKHHHTNKRRHADDGGRMLHELRNEFDTWASRHSKTYATKHEKEHRFNIWMKNHNR